jgi:ribosome-binding factor A
MPHRIERFSSTLKQSLADILMNDINNPHLKAVSITDVLVSPDLKKARVFVASSSGEKMEDVINHLDRAKGFIKKTLARRMYLKYVPEFFFLIDEDIEKPYQQDTSTSDE